MQSIEYKEGCYTVRLSPSYRDCRNGFAHDCTIWVYDDKSWSGMRSETSIHYLNRTWERYAGQSVMRKAVMCELACEVARIRDQWMDASGYQRMTAKRRESFAAYLAGVGFFRLHVLMHAADYVERYGLEEWQESSRSKVTFEQLANMA